MTSKSKNAAKKDAQVKWLADRLALALTHSQEFIRGTVMLPSRERDRESIRNDPEYERMLNTVRNVLKHETRHDG